MIVDANLLRRMMLEEFLFVKGTEGFLVNRQKQPRNVSPVIRGQQAHDMITGSQFEISRQSQTRYKVYDFTTKETSFDLTLTEVLECITQ